MNHTMNESADCQVPRRSDGASSRLGPKSQVRPRLQRGFTLVELLVVITIIVVLAALGFTTFGRVRRSAEKTTGIAAMRSLGAANALYASENNGIYVAAISFDDDGKQFEWRNDIKFKSYLMGLASPDDKITSTTVLPDSVVDPVVRRTFKSDKNHTYRWNLGKSFAINDPPSSGGVGYGKPGYSKGFRSANLADPGRTMSFITAQSFMNTYRDRLNWEKNPSDGSGTGVAYRYDGKALAVFFDGHVEDVSIERIKEIDKQKGGESNIFWSGK